MKRMMKKSDQVKILRIEQKNGNYARSFANPWIRWVVVCGLTTIALVGVIKAKADGKDAAPMQQPSTGFYQPVVHLDANEVVSTDRSSDAESVILSDEAKENMVKSIHDLVNKHRKRKGLPMLAWSDHFAKASENHSVSMMRGRTAFGHNGFESRVKSIAAKEGNLKAWAENVAKGEMGAEEVVKGWLNSPGHRKNIEGKYNITGIGIAQKKDGTIFFTQIFGLK
jgi:uncharacterized protein YkwD